MTVSLARRPLNEDVRVLREAVAPHPRTWSGYLGAGIVSAGCRNHTRRINVECVTDECELIREGEGNIAISIVNKFDHLGLLKTLRDENGGSEAKYLLRACDARCVKTANNL